MKGKQGETVFAGLIIALLLRLLDTVVGAVGAEVTNWKS